MEDPPRTTTSRLAATAGSRTFLRTSSCRLRTYAGIGPPPITLCTPSSTGSHWPTGRPNVGRLAAAGSVGLPVLGTASHARYKAGTVPTSAISTGGQARWNSTASSTVRPAVTANTATAVAPARRAPARSAGLRGRQRLKRSMTAQIHHAAAPRLLRAKTTIRMGSLRSPSCESTNSAPTNSCTPPGEPLLFADVPQRRRCWSATSGRSPRSRECLPCRSGQVPLGRPNPGWSPRTASLEQAGDRQGVRQRPALPCAGRSWPLSFPRQRLGRPPDCAAGHAARCC